MQTHKEIFTKIYENEELGNDYNPIYKGSSGRGCTLEYNKHELIPFIKQFVIDKKIKTIVDLGCGNIQYAYPLYNDVGVNYYGYDVYDKIIEYNTRFYNNKKFSFECLDVLLNKENIINADLCVIKDVLQHWNISDIYSLLDYFVNTKKFKYIMIINCNQQTNDIFNNEMDSIQTGGWRQLSANYYPLKKYNPKIVFSYQSKEISIIQTFIFSSNLECQENTFIDVMRTKIHHERNFTLENKKYENNINSIHSNHISSSLQPNLNSTSTSTSNSTSLKTITSTFYSPISGLISRFSSPSYSFNSKRSESEPKIKKYKKI